MVYGTPSGRAYLYVWLYTHTHTHTHIYVRKLTQRNNGWKLPNLGKEIRHLSPGSLNNVRIKLKRPTTRYIIINYIIIKLATVKEKILKATTTTTQKTCYTENKTLKIVSRFLSRNLGGLKAMDDILIVLEKKTKTQPRVLHPWKLPFRKREVVFQKKKTQKLNITELTLQKH